MQPIDTERENDAVQEAFRQILHKAEECGLKVMIGVNGGLFEFFRAEHLSSGGVRVRYRDYEGTEGSVVIDRVPEKQSNAHLVRNGQGQWIRIEFDQAKVSAPDPQRGGRGARIGDRFGALAVRVIITTTDGESQVFCECDCGATVKTTIAALEASEISPCKCEQVCWKSQARS